MPKPSRKTMLHEAKSEYRYKFSDVANKKIFQKITVYIIIHRKTLKTYIRKKLKIKFYRPFYNEPFGINNTTGFFAQQERF